MCALVRITNKHRQQLLKARYPWPSLSLVMSDPSRRFLDVTWKTTCFFTKYVDNNLLKNIYRT